MPKSRNLPERLTLQQARNVMLAAQGLLHAPAKKAVKSDVLAAIRRMRLLQIDTISVIARSPYLVLWTRLGDYQPSWLDELLEQGKLGEHWAHAYCFIPIEDYPFHRRRALDRMHEKTWPMGWAVNLMQENTPAVQKVRDYLKENGAVRSADFTSKKRPPGGWWNWKEEKDALEAMLLTGEVMVARRQNFQRVYDLRERVLPDWSDEKTSSQEDSQRFLDVSTIRALGLALPTWVPDYFHQPKSGVAERLRLLLEQEQLATVEIEGFKEPAYVHPDNFSLLKQAASDRLEPRLTTLLSPFDPLCWDRRRLKQLFDFEYQIECYTPAAKRKYGYFSLPILHNGRIVGRLDPKAHRSKGVFEVKSIHLEPGVEPEENLVSGLASALRSLAAWHQTPQVVVANSYPQKVSGLLREALRE